MKPLLDTDRLIIAGAALLAVMGPVMLLWPEAPSIDLPARPAVTRLHMAAADPLGPALETPLFNIGRSPLPPEPPPSAEATAEAVPPAPPPMLVGTIARRQGGGVALIKTNAGETVALSVGEEADGWRLVSVGESRAVLDQGGRREALTLDFRNKEQAVAGGGVAVNAPTTNSAASPIATPASFISNTPSQDGPTG